MATYLREQGRLYGIIFALSHRFSSSNNALDLTASVKQDMSFEEVATGLGLSCKEGV